MFITVVKKATKQRNTLGSSTVITLYVAFSNKKIQQFFDLSQLVFVALLFGKHMMFDSCP